jgi:NTE family protein
LKVKADAVFEGGGVKGIAFIGALSEMEAAGYIWEKLAGTSAGAIVAALLAAGYSSEELRVIFTQMNYHRMLRPKGLGTVPVIGPAYDLLFHKGLYPADPLESFVAELLRKKKIRTFGDLPPEKLRIIASDITEGKMLILPDDLTSFGIDPLTFPIARAVRMSSSIPYFFQPFILKRRNVSHYIVDGGLLSNFPVWLFDVEGIPRWPTIGFRLHDQNHDHEYAHISGLITFSKALIKTMLEAHDRMYVKKAQAVRTIFIQGLGVKATEFDLSEKKRMELYVSGQAAAREFLQRWDFGHYIEAFRKPAAKATINR